MSYLKLVAAAIGIAAISSLAWVLLQNEAVPAPVAEEVDLEGMPAQAVLPEAGKVHEVQILGGSGGKRCIEITDCYYPPAISVPAADTVFWSNLDDAIHTVTSGTGTDGHDGIFDSDLIFPGSTFGYEFHDTGDYDYYCILHPWMTGKVSVTESVPMTGTAKQNIMSEPVEYTHASTAVLLPFGTSVPGCEKTDSCYVPPRINIAVGTTVLWLNEDDGVHTVTSGTARDGPDGIFDTGLFLSGETFGHTFEDAGTFKYYCKVHPWMTGSVRAG